MTLLNYYSSNKVVFSLLNTYTKSNKYLVLLLANFFIFQFSILLKVNAYAFLWSALKSYLRFWSFFDIFIYFLKFLPSIHRTEKHIWKCLLLSDISCNVALLKISEHFSNIFWKFSGILYFLIISELLNILCLKIPIFLDF